MAVFSVMIDYDIFGSVGSIFVNFNSREMYLLRVLREVTVFVYVLANYLLWVHAGKCYGDSQTQSDKEKRFHIL